MARKLISGLAASAPGGEYRNQLCDFWYRNIGFYRESYAYFKLHLFRSMQKNNMPNSLLTYMQLESDIILPLQ